MDVAHSNADSEMLSERGRQAHISKLPMGYFKPIMEMLKNPWWVRISWLLNTKN